MTKQVQNLASYKLNSFGLLVKSQTPWETDLQIYNRVSIHPGNSGKPGKSRKLQMTEKNTQIYMYFKHKTTGLFQFQELRIMITFR